MSKYGDEPTPIFGEKESAIVDTSLTQWSSYGNGTFYSVGVTQKTMPPGVYQIADNKGQIIYIKQDIQVDDLMEFPNSAAAEIIKDIQDFWQRGHFFKEYGFLHRRGCMLIGAAGGGKSCIINLTLHDIVKRGGIAFVCASPRYLATGLQIFRQIEPDRYVVCVFEDIDTIIRNHGEEELLKLLDGENTINKCLNIATTNYPDKLDPRLINRPRRFDRVFKINYPNEEVRRMYFTKKLKISDSEIDAWVEATEKFSFAAMAELVISVKCLGYDFKKSVDTIRSLLQDKPSSEDFASKSLGFSAH